MEIPHLTQGYKVPKNAVYLNKGSSQQEAQKRETALLSKELGSILSPNLANLVIITKLV